MRLAKSIDELYDEVKDYDLVLCNDAPLALALNNRLDVPRIGHFAVTPRQLAGDFAIDLMGHPVMSGINVVKRISKITGRSLRYVHGEVQNIEKMNHYKTKLNDYLRNKGSKEIYEEYLQLPTLNNVMIKLDSQDSDIKSNFFKDKKVAIIGEELFDNLDKQITPVRFDSISTFKKGDFSINEIRELNNDRQIAENVVSLITKENSYDFAIVLDVGGNIADAVRSALYRKRIPFINSLSVRDLNNIREFLEFLSLSLTFDTVKISQVRELIFALNNNHSKRSKEGKNYKIESKFDRYLALQYVKLCKDDETRKLLELMRDIKDKTYVEVCDAIADGQKAAQIKVLLNEMELTNNRITSEDTNEMIYAVNNINDLKHNEQIPDYEKEGVLLVDCKNSVYVDRPNVIFIGMGQEWEKDLSELNLVDYRMKDDEVDKNVDKFNILMQQGVNRIYVCNSIKNGEKPKPCSYFDISMNKTVKNFNDVSEKIVSGPWYTSEDSNGSEVGDITVDSTSYEPKPFSKTMYNSFITCPKSYMFGRILGDPDNSNIVTGNLIHEYAEARICYPEEVKRLGIDHYAEYISNECIGLFPPEIRSVEHYKIRNSLINIDNFVERMKIAEKAQVCTIRNPKKPNVFIDELKQKFGSDITEVKFTSNEEHMEGIMDVALNNQIIDFKTGRPNNLKDIIDKMKLDAKYSSPREFQCMFYLSLMEDIHPGAVKRFTLFYTNDNLDKNINGEQFDILENTRDVIVIEDKMEYFEGEYLDNVFGLKKYNFINTFRDVVVEEIKKTGLDNIDDDFADELTSVLEIKTKTDQKYMLDFVKKISKDFKGVEQFNTGRCDFITRKSLNDFRKQIGDDYDRIKDYYMSQFPADSHLNCKNCTFNDVCIYDITKEVIADDGTQ